jgi:outer membrane protein W
LKLLRSVSPVLLAVCLGAGLASAQSVYFGVGTTQLSSNGQTIDTFGTGNRFSTPSMTGAFGKVGGDLMITPHFGVGAETDFRFSQGAYAGLTYRPVFYDFNAIYTPVRPSRRIVPEFQGGLGAVNTRFFYSSQFCDPFAGCSNNNQFVEGSNHFQVHMAAGLRFYVTPHFFVKPQVDAHYVNNFFQFGSNWVPEYSASIGWRFGER